MKRRTFLQTIAAALSSLWFGKRARADDSAFYLDGSGGGPVAGAYWDEPERVVTFKGAPLVWEREYRPTTATEACVLDQQGHLPIMESYLETTRGREIILDTTIAAAQIQALLYGRAAVWKPSFTPEQKRLAWRFGCEYLEPQYIVDRSVDDVVWRDVEGFEEILVNTGGG